MFRQLHVAALRLGRVGVRVPWVETQGYHMPPLCGWNMDFYSK